MKLEDNICPICLYIYIQPVTMPCHHELCLTCFKQNVEEANFCCPLCRIRISTWARKAARTKTLVNEARWEEIQLHFPDQIRKRQDGEEEEDMEMNALNISIKLAEPGEIRTEYEQQLKKLQEERAEEREVEQEASERLIREMQDEEARRKAKLQALHDEDEELVKHLSKVDGPGSELELRTRSGTGNSRDSRSGDTIENFLSKLHDSGAESCSPPRSPYPYPCLTPISSGTGKLCVDKDRARQMEQKLLKSKIKKDKNLITTTDIEKLEETFTRNCRSKMASATEIAIPDSLQTGSKASVSPTLLNVMSAVSLHQSEILDQMSTDVCINMIDDDSSNSNLISLSNSPVRDTKEGHCPSPEPSPGLSRSVSSHSIDSISQELNHFRPIRSCPLTPPRRLPSGKVVEPKLIRTTPRHLSGSGFTSPAETNLSDIDAGSPVMQRRLSQLADERKDQVERMSKSTSTGVVVSPDENHNPKRKILPTAGHLNFTHVGLKDISNSPLTTQDLHPGRKLIIPLEPDLETDWLTTQRSVSPVKIERVAPVQLSDSAQKRAAKLSRSRFVKTSKVRYTTEGPQPSLMKWIKTGDSVCINNGRNADRIVGNRQDEVDCDKCISGKSSEPLMGTEALDEHLLNNRNSNYTRSRRSHRLYRDPAYVYGGSVTSGNVETVGDAISLNRNDDICFSGNCGKRKISSKCESSPRKKWKVGNQQSNEDTSRKKPGLKRTKQTVKSGRLIKSGCIKPKAQVLPVRTMRDFFNNLNNSALNEDRTDSEGEMDQEDKDRLLAIELQEQFQLEARYNLTTLRFKGTPEEYSLRRNRKSKQIIDA